MQLTLKQKAIAGASIAGIVLAIAYGCWLKLGATPVKPGQTIPNLPPPKAVKDEPVKTVQVPVIVYRDRERVITKLGLPPAEAKEEVQTAAVIPAMKYGGKAAVYLNTTTGKSRMAVVANEAPWLAWERGNTVGIGAGISREGRYFTGDYKRDVLSVKGVVLAGQVGVTSFQDRTDARAEIRAEYRW